ncbi:hydrolase [Jannaschia pagri]|uniref:Hydrolase n=1 Tax=Jannaschia pagri TaxID=2829797 RepID=A0ABQ4NGG9_9RHOB|nr:MULTISPECIES: alpha/beta hydrolase [unclassified Jannaschia]GIT90379.1 hydrolase [Jannaschia sp. AI_61]GIT93515.1 hydrolase [Jannaschia sp. AI_62]
MAELRADTAPYYEDVACGPAGGHAVWLSAPDGIRIRVGVWPEGSRGTVFLFPGRTEYVEKYSDAAQHLADAGYAALAIDWRGQGLTERPAHDRKIGHVKDFRDFQRDVDAMLAHARSLGLPRPWHLLAHSMGGLIGLRSLMERQVFARAAFSAPMWGLPLPPHLRAVAWTVSSLGSAIGLGERDTPRSGKVADPAAAPFDGNLLTTDPDMFAWMQRQVVRHPDLALGGPSLGWLWAALREMHGLARQAAPDTPCLTLLGSDEGIVDPDAIQVRLASWPGARLRMVEGARHEALMEGTDLRGALYRDIIAHFEG